jgi:serine/threonine-protein kinase RIO1
LGSGGTANVYLAYNQKGDKVAIKVFEKEKN